MLRAACARRGAAARGATYAPAPARSAPALHRRKEGREAVGWQQIKAAFVEHGRRSSRLRDAVHRRPGVAGVYLSGLDAQEWIRSGVEAAAGIDLSGLLARLINGVIASGR